MDGLRVHLRLDLEQLLSTEKLDVLSFVNVTKDELSLLFAYVCGVFRDPPVETSYSLGNCEDLFSLCMLM